MQDRRSNRISSGVTANGAQRVLVATTAMLAFISFWRAAAVVLNDMGSSAFYAGAISEHFVGKTAPWFILAIMLLSYAVRAVYIESCSMFVRGGVYRVVKEAMGGTLAKFSVSALMFDYILTGPISGVSAGLYLTGLLNELLHYTHSRLVLPMNGTAALFAAIVTLYFWWENIKGIPESSEKALRIMYVTTVMVVLMIAWCVYTLWVRGAHLPPWPHLSNLVYSTDALGWLRHTSLPYTVGLIGILVGLGHSVLAMSGEETMAQVYREIEHPKLKNLEKAGFVIFTYSLIFTAGVAFFAVMIIPDSVRNSFFDNPIGGLAMYLVGPLSLRLAFRGFVVVWCLDASRGSQYRHRRFEWSIEPGLRGWNSAPLVSASAPAFRHFPPHSESSCGAPASHHCPQPGKHLRARRGLCLRCDVELRHEGPRSARTSLQATWQARISCPLEPEGRRFGNPGGLGLDHNHSVRFVPY